MSTEPENATTTPSTTMIWQGPAATPRIIEVKPDDWKRRMTSDEVAELHAKGWIIQPPITFVHPTTQEGMICYLCLPPRPEKVTPLAPIVDAQQQAARDINDAQQRTTYLVGVVAAASITIAVLALVQGLHWLFS